MALAIGGGGGSGGVAISGSVTVGGSDSLALSLGGAGSGGGSKGGFFVDVASSGDLSTEGDLSSALVAQSIGGGGGMGGTSISGTVSTASTKALSASIGGRGGSSGAGSFVLVTVNNDITTSGAQSDGILAQSIGGSGGNGGTSVSGNITTSNSTQIGLGIGGGAGNAGAGGAVTLNPSDSVDGLSHDITVTGDGSRGIVAQSIGGGGGNGGMAVTGNMNTGQTTKSLNLTLGGTGGAGGAGGAVTVSHVGAISTGVPGTQSLAELNYEHGILAQSISGGGGNGGLAVSGSTNRGNRSLSLTIGGRGGSGIQAGDVSVSKDGSIITHAPFSHGILAQSIAGGGGNGGGTTTYQRRDADKEAKSFAVSVGGGGGTGNTGGAVTITNNASIAVSGLGSQGIVAQSFGGGGGNGGSNVFQSKEDSATAGILTVGIGGFAGAGGGGGDVSVVSSGAIVTGTSGTNADDLVSNTVPGYGIFAQSVSSGGGNGGIGISGDLETSGDKSLTVGVGGAGAGSADGGSVSVQTGAGGTVQTFDDGAHGIFAQSIAGGGGNGAAGINGDVSNGSSNALTLGVGGSAGPGGAGGSVTVELNDDVTVVGDGAKGVVAQSIGGGGGNGAIGIEGDLSGSDDSATNQLSVGLGGSGGSGGAGGPVKVTVNANITTGSDTDGLASTAGAMDGIFAQSIAGGGGNVSAGIAGDITNSSEAKAVTLGFSLSGGTANSSGQVAVVSAGSKISVSGDGSRGIVAQSLGGAGGEGSVGIDGNIESVDSASSTTQLDLGIGGAGGGGGSGNAVSVTNAAAIFTNASDLGGFTENHGIVAQSLGGGGGNGGIGISGDVTNATKSKALTIGVGGSSKSGGNGGSVTVTNSSTGAIGVSGARSVGIFAQSLGGGGGTGGIGIEGNVAGADDASATTQLEFGLGGSGGAGGSGGKVFVSNAASIASALDVDGEGSQMHGVFAQSIGGGGGSGNVGVKGDISGSKDSKALTLAVGGSGGSRGSAAAGAAGTVEQAGVGVLAINLGAKAGSTGAGGVVTVNSSTAVKTFGDGAIGIFAQSVGGGGGKAATEANGVSGTFTLGAIGSASGAGGAVSVAVGGDGVTTQGARAHGVVAQSIGGGGGYAGAPAFAGRGTFGSGQGFGEDGTGKGNGGSVSVTLNGSSSSNLAQITTRGTFSAGIFAQSVGGGGGVAGPVGGDTLGATIGSGSGSGSGGSVAVDLTDAFVRANASQSYGIFAQSAGGSGTSVSSQDKVVVRVLSTAGVNASGAGSTGIYAQSSGEGRGNVVVEVLNSFSVVQGGTNSTVSNANGAAIFIKDGASNSVRNFGIVRSAAGADGNAIVSRGSVGTTTVTNNGAITGRILLFNNPGGASATSGLAAVNPSRVVNEAGGTLSSTLVEADETVNRGTLIVGPDGEIGTTQVAGNYTQFSAGTLVIGLDPEKAGSTDPVSDELIIDGAAAVAGTVEVTLLSAAQGEQGEITTRILRTTEDQALGAAAAADLEVTPSAVARYRLSSDANDDTFLSFDIDYANEFAAAPMGNNTFRASKNFNLLAQAGGVDDATGNELVSFSDPRAYATFMDTLNSEVFVNNQITTVRSNLLFNNQMTRCEENGSAYRSPDDRYCLFLTGGASQLDRDATASNEGFKSTWWQLTSGGEVALGEHWRVGGALAYQSRTQKTDSHNNSTSDGDGFLLGVYATRLFGPVELTGSVMTGGIWFDTTRNPLNEGATTATQTVWTVSTRVGAGYLYNYEKFYVRPRMDFGFDFVDGSSFSEDGDNLYRLEVNGNSDYFFTAQPSVEVGFNFQPKEGVTIRPRLSVGVVQFIGNSSASMTARYANGPASLPYYKTNTDLGSTQVELGGGFDIISVNDFTLRADGFGSLNSDYSNYGGGLSVVVPF